jgi:hypothetical protein
MYQPYLNNFEKAEERRTELLLENEHFSHFCINARKHPSCHNLGLMDYLIEPIQRIPRYKMLLQQIQKYSIKDPEPNDLYKKITEALERVSYVAKEIDAGLAESQETRKNREVMLEVMMSFTWNTKLNLLDAPHRRLIKVGTLMRQTRKTVKPFQFWLFSDILIYGEEIPAIEGIYSVHRTFNLDKVRASVPPPSLTVDNPEKALFIETSQKSFIVWTNSETEKKEWFNILYATIHKCQTSASRGNNGDSDNNNNLNNDNDNNDNDGNNNNDIKQLEKSNKDLGVAPMWTPDTASSTCEVCDNTFSILLFRHHCRKCGNIVCGNCSSQTYLLENVSHTHESRVCDPCFRELIKSDPNYNTIEEYFAKKQVAQDSTRLGRVKSSIKNSIVGVGSSFMGIMRRGSSTISYNPEVAGLSSSSIAELELESKGDVDGINEGILRDSYNVSTRTWHDSSDSEDEESTKTTEAKDVESSVTCADGNANADGVTDTEPPVTPTPATDSKKEE